MTIISVTFPPMVACKAQCPCIFGKFHVVQLTNLEINHHPIDFDKLMLNFLLFGHQTQVFLQSINGFPNIFNSVGFEQ